MIAPHVLEELRLHLDGEYPADGVGKVLKGFLFGLTLRHATRQIDAFSDPAAVYLITLGQDRQMPSCRGLIIISPRLKRPNGSAESLKDRLHQGGLRPACAGGVVGHLETS